MKLLINRIKGYFSLDRRFKFVGNFIAYVYK